MAEPAKPFSYLDFMTEKERKFLKFGGMMINISKDQREDIVWLTNYLADKKVLTEPDPNQLAKMALFKMINEFKIAMGMTAAPGNNGHAARDDYHRAPVKEGDYTNAR